MKIGLIVTILILALSIAIYLITKKLKNSDHQNPEDTHGDINADCTKVTSCVPQQTLLRRRPVIDSIPLNIPRNLLKSIKPKLTSMTKSVIPKSVGINSGSGPFTLCIDIAESVFSDTKIALAPFVTIKLFTSGKVYSFNCVLDTGSGVLLVNGAQCNQSVCGRDYGIWPCKAPNKLTGTCRRNSYGSGTAISETWSASMITNEVNDSLPIQFNVIEKVESLNGMDEFPCIAGLIPNIKGLQENNLISHLIDSIKEGDRGFTLDLITNKIVFGHIDTTTGSPVDLLPMKIPGINTSIYFFYMVTISNAEYISDNTHQHNTLNLDGPIILDTGTTGIDSTVLFKALQVDNQTISGTLNITLTNGIVLSSKFFREIVGENIAVTSDTTIPLMGINGLIGHRMGFDLVNHKLYIN